MASRRRDRGSPLAVEHGRPAVLPNGLREPGEVALVEVGVDGDEDPVDVDDATLEPCWFDPSTGQLDSRQRNSDGCGAGATTSSRRAWGRQQLANAEKWCAAIVSRRTTKSRHPISLSLGGRR